MSAKKRTKSSNDKHAGGVHTLEGRAVKILEREETKNCGFSTRACHSWAKN